MERMLRNEEEYYLPMARTKMAERMPLYTFPSSWNSFQDDILKIDSNEKNFKKGLKNALLSQLSPVVTCDRFNCPTSSL